MQGLRAFIVLSDNQKEVKSKDISEKESLYANWLYLTSIDTAGLTGSSFPHGASEIAHYRIILTTIC